MALALGLIILTGSLATWLKSYLSNGVVIDLDEELKNRMVRKVMRIHTSCFVYLAWVDLSMTLVVVIFAPLTGLFSRLITKHLRRSQTGFREKMDDAMAVARDSIAGMDVVKAYNLQEHRIGRFGEDMDRAVEHIVRFEKYNALSGPVRFVRKSLPTFVYIVLAMIRFGRGALSGGELMAYSYLLRMISAPLASFQLFVNDHVRAAVSYSRYDEIMSYGEEAEGEGALEVAGAPVYEFRGAGFSYGEGRRIIENLDLTLEEGRTYALVGPSGGGKSTLFRLMAGLYRPTEGRLLFRGNDIGRYRLDQLRGNISYVSQEAFLFPQAVAENIGCGKAGPCREEIIRAARAAYAHGFISALPDGYDTVLNENGGNLSGGQRQRLAIARALLRNAPVFMLDEMTSALDYESERYIQRSLDGLGRDKTIIIIAHRLSTVINADEIIVLDRGRIVERGAHGDLLRRNGLYAVLLEGYLLKRLMDGEYALTDGFILRTALLLLAYLILLAVLMPLFLFLQNGSAKYGTGRIFTMIHSKIVRLPMKFFDGEHSGSLMSLLQNDGWGMSSIVSRHLSRVTTATIRIVFFMIPMLAYDWRVSSALFSFNIVTMAVNASFSGILKRLSREFRNEQGLLNARFADIIGGMSLLRLYGMTSRFTENFAAGNRNLVRLSRKRAGIDALLATYGFFISLVNMALFIFLGFLFVQKGQTTYGNILAVMTLSTSLDANFRELSLYFPHFYRNLASAEKIRALMEREEEPESHGPAPAEPGGYLSLEGVTMAYGDEPVLKDFSLRLDRGDRLAVTGESGCGKSTLAKLLLGFYPSRGGSMAFAGECASRLTLREIRVMIAYVPQDSYVFSGTIRENILMGDRDAGDEAVERAARIACAHDFIGNLDRGFETQVGERGIRLSGGQRQRIAIARAVLKDAPILLFDEATSNLDRESERIITETINSISLNKTSIIIAHRLSSQENCTKHLNMGRERKKSPAAKEE